MLAEYPDMAKDARQVSKNQEGLGISLHIRFKTLSQAKVPWGSRVSIYVYGCIGGALQLQDHRKKSHRGVPGLTIQDQL